jgi:hypothetical protein
MTFALVLLAMALFLAGAFVDQDRAAGAVAGMLASLVFILVLYWIV